ncbi:MAG: DMT family transporter [Pseudomonadota bacterium]
MPTQSKRPFDNAYVVLIVAPLFWGGNAVAGKLATLDWQPFTITCLRWFLTMVLLTPFAWPHMQREADLLKRSWPILFLLGAVGMALFNLFMYLSLNYTTAVNVSIEQATMPGMIMLANFILLSQRVSPLQIAGLLACVVGVLITATGGKPWTFFEQGLNRGDAIMLLACVFYVGYTFGLRWKPVVHWLVFIWMIALGATTTSLPLMLWELQQQTFTMPSLRGWLVMAYVVLFPTVVSQIAYARGVELIGSNRAGLFINLVPIFGSLLAVLILGEQFHLYHALGLILVVGGIMFAEHHVVK